MKLVLVVVIGGNPNENIGFLSVESVEEPEDIGVGFGMELPKKKTGFGALLTGVSITSDVLAIKWLLASFFSGSETAPTNDCLGNLELIPDKCLS